MCSSEVTGTEHAFEDGLVGFAAIEVGLMPGKSHTAKEATQCDAVEGFGENNIKEVFAAHSLQGLEAFFCIFYVVLEMRG